MSCYYDHFLSSIYLTCVSLQNTSLAALGNVIAARVENRKAPYRDSALTHLLQDSLEKNSKTLMFVQISPSRSDVTETVCSLKFAERAAKVELGKAQVNVRKEGSIVKKKSVVE